MFKPKLDKKFFIALSAFWGLAVKTNMSSEPLASCIFLATSNKGPFLPSITFSNSVKSNLAPCCSSSAALCANSVAFILNVSPSNVSTSTLLLDLANVSSKSNTLAFLIFSEYLGLLAFLIALSAMLSFLTCDLASGLKVPLI